MIVITRFASELIQIEEVPCLGASPARGPEETVTQHEIIFTRLGAFVRHDAAGSTLGDANHVLFFNAGQPYQVSHPVAGGDCCVIFRLRPAALLDLIRPSDPAVDDRPDRPFATNAILAEARLRLRHHHLQLALRQPLRPEPLLVEEVALELLADALSAPAVRQPARASAELAEAVKVVLNARFREKLSLAEVAGAVHCSPYHLSRVFRRTVGLPIHQYLRRLRLLNLLERLADDPRAEIMPLAVECGFDSHSHATAACRQVFGQPPSRLRQAPAARDAGGLGQLQMRTILKA